MLVGIPIIPSNESADMVLLHQDKIDKYITRLQGSNLNPQDILFGYERGWLPSLRFAVLVLTIPRSGMVLAPLHKDSLRKLKVIRTFPLFMRSAPESMGGLDLRSLEITSGAQSIYHLVSLFTSCTPSKLLLITAIEHHQLEIGVEGLFFSTSYNLLSKLATSTWITHL